MTEAEQVPVEVPDGGYGSDADQAMFRRAFDEAGLAPTLAAWKSAALIAARVRAAFHVPEIASTSTGWGVFCAACSTDAGDYVYPCRLPNAGDWWAEFPERIGPSADTERDAQVRAEERQRIAAMIQRDAETLNAFAPGCTAELVAYLVGNIAGAAGSAVPVATPEPSDETRCHRCGGKNCTWSAPSPLWNEVMRGGDINGPWQWNEIICPPCFAELAETSGVAARGWRFTADRVLVPLATSTPSGRVWDEAKQLWVEPVATPTEPVDKPEPAGHCCDIARFAEVPSAVDLLVALQASVARAHAAEQDGQR